MGLARLFPVIFNTISIPAGRKIGNLFPSPLRVPGQNPQTGADEAPDREAL